MIENQPKMYKAYWTLVARMASEVFGVENAQAEAEKLWSDLLKAGVDDLMYHASAQEYAESLAGLDFKDVTPEQQEKLNAIEVEVWG